MMCQQHACGLVWANKLLQTAVGTLVWGHQSTQA